MAADGVFDAGAGAVLGRHLLSPCAASWLAWLYGGVAWSGRRLSQGTGASAGEHPAGESGTAADQLPTAFRRPAGDGPSRRCGPGPQLILRAGQRRVRRCAEVPHLSAVPGPAAPVPSHQGPEDPRHGPSLVVEDGVGRHVRPYRRRFSPVLHRQPVAGPPL